MARISIFPQLLLTAADWQIFWFVDSQEGDGSPRNCVVVFDIRVHVQGSDGGGPNSAFSAGCRSYGFRFSQNAMMKSGCCLGRGERKSSCEFSAFSCWLFRTWWHRRRILFVPEILWKYGGTFFSGRFRVIFQNLEQRPGNVTKTYRRSIERRF